MTTGSLNSEPRGSPRSTSQVKSLMARAEELQRKLEEAGESNRIITQAVRLKQDELDELSVINSAINRQLKVGQGGVRTGREEGGGGGMRFRGARDPVSEGAGFSERGAERTRGNTRLVVCTSIAHPF